MKKDFLVTGASRGLGYHIARHLLAEGHSVIAMGRSVNKALTDLSAEFPNLLQILTFDLEKADDVSAFFKSHIPFDRPLHGFVNNAAIAYDDIITNLHLDALERMFRVNVFSPMLLTKLVIRHMLLHHIPGSLVHISSISVHTGYKGLAMYASSKGALEAFSKNTAREWGERGIRSNCIVAGFMETDMSSGLTTEQKTRIYSRTSLKKATSPESVASTAAFLLSESSSSITGQNIFIDSGTI